MLKKFDLAVKVGSYVNSQGEDKAKWENIGVVMENNEGNQFILLKRTFNPAGINSEKESILISMFTPKIKESNTNNTKQEEQWT